MANTSPHQEHGTHSLRSWATVVLLIAAATLCSAMLYVLVIVIAAYRLDWVQSVVCAVGAVTALNFFFVPPRWTFEVESREHLIALVVMLVVALVISHLASSLRRESLHAALSEQRARQLQALASALANMTMPGEIADLGQRALDAAFDGPNALLLVDDANELIGADQVPDALRDSMRCCRTEAAVLGPGTGRWTGLNAWYLPLGDTGHVMGAACVQPALASDTDGREHAQALCTLLAQALWRVRLAAIVGAASSLQTQHDKLSTSEQERLLGSIVSEASYLSTLTENTLQLVRLTSVQQELQRDWESLEEIVGAVLARVRQRDPGRRIKSKVPAGGPALTRPRKTLFLNPTGAATSRAHAGPVWDWPCAAPLRRAWRQLDGPTPQRRGQQFCHHPAGGRTTTRTGIAMRLNVLVVEDDREIRAMMQSSLSVEGFEVQTAVSLSEARALLQHKPPDIIVLDLGLPDGDGAELVRELRKQHSTPVIVVSARHQEAQKIALLDAGADDYLTKPFSVGELLARMRVALRHRGTNLTAAVTLHELDNLRVDLSARRVERDPTEPRHLLTETGVGYRLADV